MTTSLEVPDPAQRLLLQAAVCKGSITTDSWIRWKEATDFKRLDPSSQWLLPLLYRNLKEHAVPEKALLPYRSVYRQNWYKNILTLKALKAILADLRQQALTCVVYGPAALTLAQYGDLGVRPIHELNLLCPERHSEVLEAVVTRQGWQPTGECGHFVEGIGRKLKISCSPEIALTEDPVAFVSFAGERVPTLDRHAHLHLVLKQNVRWDEKSSLLWIADSASIIRTLNLQEIDLFRFKYRSHIALIELITHGC